MNRLRQPGDSDYDVLGLSPQATGQEIEIAFRELIDGEGYRVGVPLNRQWLRAHQIKHAHATVSDPVKRRAYDESLSRADQGLWVAGAENPPAVELVLPSPRARRARPTKNRRASNGLDAVRPGPARKPDTVPAAEAEEIARPIRNGPPSPDLSPPLNDNEGDSRLESIGNSKSSVRSWGLAAVLLIGLGLLFIPSWLEWDLRPTTIEETSGVARDERRASLAGIGNDVTVQAASEPIPKEKPETQSPAVTKPADVTRPTANPSTSAANTAEARAIAPDEKPPIARPPKIQKAPVAAVSPGRPVGIAPQWIGGGPIDADNRGGRHQGTVALQVNVEPSGRVSKCAPVRGSGNAGLDKLTCRLVRQRARFVPARDPQGRRVEGQAYMTFAWVRKPRN